MLTTEQTLQNQENLPNFQSGDLAERIERAKQLYCLFNNITFGNKAEANESRNILKQFY